MAQTNISGVQSGLTIFLLTQRPREIFDEIVSYLSMNDFRIFRQVCRSFNQEELFKDRFSVNRLLRHFVSNPVKLRSYLAEDDGLISGNFALNFFNECRTEIPELVIWVSHRIVDDVRQYLVSDEGYEAHSQEPPAEHAYAYTIMRYEGRTRRIIHLYEGEALAGVLGQAAFTSMANFITWDKAYTLFPLETVVKHKMFPLQRRGVRMGLALMQLADLGWTTRDLLESRLWPDFANLHFGLPRIGKPKTLTVALDVEGICPGSHSTIAESRYEVVKRMYQYLQWRQQTRHAISLRNLRYAALFRPIICLSASWSTFFETNLFAWLNREIHKCLANYPKLVPHKDIASDELTLLGEKCCYKELFDFADDQMSVWYEQWYAFCLESGELKPYLMKLKRGLSRKEQEGGSPDGEHEGLAIVRVQDGTSVASEQDRQSIEAPQDRESVRDSDEASVNDSADDSDNASVDDSVDDSANDSADDSDDDSDGELKS